MCTTRPPDLIALEHRVAAETRAIAAARTNARYSDDSRTRLRDEADEQAARRRLIAAQAALANAEEERKRALARLHIAASQLGLDETTRRAQIARISGGRTASAAGLTAKERAALDGEYRAAGWRARKADGGRRGDPQADAETRRPTLARVRALLSEQALPWSYAEAILRRQRNLPSGVACPLASADEQELRGVVAALYRKGKRS